MVKKIEEKICCIDASGASYEVSLFHNFVFRRNARGVTKECPNGTTARLADSSAVYQTGRDTFKIVWNGKKIRRVGS